MHAVQRPFPSISYWSDLVSHIKLYSSTKIFLFKLSCGSSTTISGSFVLARLLAYPRIRIASIHWAVVVTTAVIATAASKPQRTFIHFCCPALSCILTSLKVMPELLALSLFDWKNPPACSSQNPSRIPDNAIIIKIRGTVQSRASNSRWFAKTVTSAELF